MSELVNTHANGKNFRRQLLVTVSAIALIGSAFVSGDVKAADDVRDRPTVWIELGGQLNRMSDGQEAFVPAIMAGRPSTFLSSQKFEKLPLYNIDETGKVFFEPSGSDWVFSASIRYGRSSSEKHVIQHTSPKPNIVHFTIPGTTPIPITVTQFPIAGRFADTSVQNGERHAIVDFQAGKDVGLGMFGGKDGASVLNLGVRFAQFSNNATIALKSDPDFQRSYKYLSQPTFGIYHLKEVRASGYHSNAASIRTARSFHGIGPSLSWNASAPLVGNPQNSELTFDWGVNAAVLFGRQRAHVQHHATGQNRPLAHYGNRQITYQPLPVDISRARTVAVPNVGGFAGASWRIQWFKVSAGYRADFFLGAMDGGIDSARKENVGFYGPFASVSVGLGG